MASSKRSRREFLLRGGIGAFSLGTWPSLSHSANGSSNLSKSFKLGIAGYSFKELDIDTSIAILKKVNAHYLSIKNFHLPLNCTIDEAKAFQQKLADGNITGHCVGPIYMHTEYEIDQAFDYARRVGVPMIIGVPDYELLPYTEKKVKEFDIKLAIHNHGPDNLPYPTAGFIMDRIKDMDIRMGICLDIGHNTRSHEDPSLAMKKYKDRIFDLHIKDLNKKEKDGKDVELGRGVIDLPAFFRTVKQVKYTGCYNIEHEKDMKDPLPGIAESVGYLNGVMDSI